MQTPLLTLSLILASTSAATAVYWGLVPIRLRRIDRSVRCLRSGLDLPPARGRVSVIVPAHNEERVIGDLVRTILAQREVDIELVIALDRCTDASRAEVERAAQDDPRVRILEIDECPPDWAGKCHAASRGAAIATGDWLVFTDADVHFDPDAIRAAVAISQAEDIDLLSAFTNLTGHAWYHVVVQPPAAVTLLRMFPPDRVNNENRPRSFANGQFMAFPRATYERLGGHEAVRGSVLEDLAFAAAVHEIDGRIRVVRAEEMIVTDMYASLEAMLLGWRRIYIESTKRNLGRLLRNAILLLGSGLAPLGGWAAIVLGVLSIVIADSVPVGIVSIATGVAGLLAQAFTLGSIFRRGGFPRRGLLLWSIGCLLLSREFLRGITDLKTGRPIRWGGREYVLEPGPR